MPIVISNGRLNAMAFIESRPKNMRKGNSIAYKMKLLDLFFDDKLVVSKD